MRAATAEFAAHALAGARISRIVQKAGTNPRMIYEHSAASLRFMSPPLKTRWRSCAAKSSVSTSSISIPCKACFGCSISRTRISSAAATLSGF